MHKDMDVSSILDKLNIVLRNSTRMLKWLKVLYGKGLKDWRMIAIAVSGAAKQ